MALSQKAQPAATDPPSHRGTPAGGDSKKPIAIGGLLSPRISADLDALLIIISLELVQKLIRILSRQESVVPLRQHPVVAQAQLVHLRIGDLNAGGIILGDQTACDAEPCGGRGFTDELGDQWVSLERDASPVFADLAEQAMFDGVPFGSAGGIVTDGDRQVPGVNKR